jgi:hypothetical protein
VLESATSNSTVVGVQSVERVKSVDLVDVGGTLDQFLTHCGVEALSDADAIASRTRFAAVMDAWWRQLRSLDWKTENGVLCEYDRLFVAAATHGCLASELEEAHPIAQSLLFSLFASLRSGLGALLGDMWLFTERDLARGGWAPLHGVRGCDEDAGGGVPAHAPRPAEASNSPWHRAAFRQAAMSIIAQAAATSAAAPNAESNLAIDAQSGAHWVSARRGFSKAANNKHRQTDAAVFLHCNRDGRAPFNHCAQAKVIWTFELKRDMSEQSVHEAEAQIMRDYAAVAGSTRRAVAPLMFAMVSNGAMYKLYKLSTGQDGLLCMEASSIFNIATEAALVNLQKTASEQASEQASEWCASFGGNAGVADAVAFPVAFERIMRHLMKSVDGKSELPHLPSMATQFVAPVVSFALENRVLTVGKVLAVTQRNVVALCEVREGKLPAKQCVIKMRIVQAPQAMASVEAEVAGVELCKELFELFPHPPPKLIGTVLDRALLFEHVEGVPLIECCMCSAAKRKHVYDLLMRDARHCADSQSVGGEKSALCRLAQSQRVCRGWPTMPKIQLANKLILIRVIKSRLARNGGRKWTFFSPKRTQMDIFLGAARFFFGRMAVNE